MKINCNQPNCKNHKSCNLKEPLPPEHQLLHDEIHYLLKQLKKIRWRLQEYQDIQEDINNGIYNEVNVFGVTIMRPEHVNYGWNWNKLQKTKEDLTEKVRKLRSIEYHIEDYSKDEIIEIIKEMESKVNL